MKKINDIFLHLKANPQFRRLSTSSLLKNLIELLPIRLKRGIKFVYIKRQTLYFVLTHPVFKIEFEYNKADIKSLLKKAKIANVEDINFFVSNKIEKKKVEKKIEIKYKERSYGIFENIAKNKEVYKKFEEIRKIINTNIET